MRISRSGLATSGSSVSTRRLSPSLPSARTTIGMALPFAGVWSISIRRGSARLLPISASASTARSLTHQSASRVAWMRDSTARSSLVWLRISMAARRMSSSLSRTSCSTASMTFGPPILPSASAARLRTHQSLSLSTSSRYLTDLALPISLSTSTAQQRGHPLDVDGAVHPLHRREDRPADQLVGILEQALQCVLDFRAVEARERVDDVHARDRVLALQTPHQLGDRGLVGDLADEPKECRLLVRLLGVGRGEQLPNSEARLLGRNHLEHRGLRDPGYRQRLEQQVRRVVAAGGERPGDAGDDPGTAFHQPAHEDREGLLAHEARKHFHEGHGGGLVRFRQRGEYGLDGAGTDVLQPRDRLLGGRAVGIIR